LTEVKRVSNDLPYISEMGDFNSLPRPFRPSDLQSFFHYWFMYHPKYVENRQVIFNSFNNTPHTTQLVYFHDKAFALVQLIETTIKGVSIDVRVFEIGCVHQWQRTSVGTKTKLYCPICGTTDWYDSSD